MIVADEDHAEAATETPEKIFPCSLALEKGLSKNRAGSRDYGASTFRSSPQI
jgi:hypothetical protein